VGEIQRDQIDLSLEFGNYKRQYDKLHEYALLWTQTYGLSDEFADVAMDRVEDCLIDLFAGNKQVESLTAYLKSIIRHGLRRISERREAQVVSTGQAVARLDETRGQGEGSLGRYCVKPTKVRNLKVRLDQITDSTQREIVRLHQIEGLKPLEIADKLKITRSYIYRILRRYLT
jgi:DNA-directed RNA polymerase specialized sigma24 family protein